MELRFAIYQTAIGDIRVEHNGCALTGLKILTCKRDAMGTADPFTDMVIGQIREYIRGERREFSIPIDISHSTPFQQRVYGELLKIPHSKRCSYKEIATRIGQPTASRAVGMANNRNPIHIIIPCHRVVGSRGALTGYAAGVETKELLLGIESYLLRF